MRKITTVFCMLLVSAILLAASSYAWFSMNNQVTATGLDVTVTVPSSLSISVTNELEGFIASVALENDSLMGETIMPTVYGKNPNGLKERDFFVLTEDAMATVNENGDVLVDYDMSYAATPMSLADFILTSGAATGTKITAYGFISGSDEDCKNSAITADSTLQVKITFFGAED